MNLLKNRINTLDMPLSPEQRLTLLETLFVQVMNDLALLTNIINKNIFGAGSQAEFDAKYKADFEKINKIMADNPGGNMNELLKDIDINTRYFYDCNSLLNRNKPLKSKLSVA